jgi:NAD(P)-dependent dehydrogenase (short-subunit alcohol dehydrogenase family)
VCLRAGHKKQHRAVPTQRAVEREGRRCILLSGDVADPKFCREAVKKTVDELGKLDILVNNAAFQEHVNKLGPQHETACAHPDK